MTGRNKNFINKPFHFQLSNCTFTATICNVNINLFFDRTVEASMDIDKCDLAPELYYRYTC